LEIVCNSESITKCEAAKYFAKNLESIGFSVNVTILTWPNYLKAIENGNFDFYIGETVLSPNMDVNRILSASICRNNRNYKEDQSGISELDSLISVTEDFLNGDADMRKVVAEFFECQPYIPLYYTEGALAVNRDVDGEFLPSETNIYNLIETWTGNE
jgi:ABC-type transport system substrate-binding protein